MEIIKLQRKCQFLSFSALWLIVYLSYAVGTTNALEKNGESKSKSNVKSKYDPGSFSLYDVYKKRLDQFDGQFTKDLQAHGQVKRSPKPGGLYDDYRSRLAKIVNLDGEGVFDDPDANLLSAGYGDRNKRTSDITKSIYAELNEALKKQKLERCARRLRRKLQQRFKIPDAFKNSKKITDKTVDDAVTDSSQIVNPPMNMPVLDEEADLVAPEIGLEKPSMDLHVDDKEDDFADTEFKVGLKKTSMDMQEDDKEADFADTEFKVGLKKPSMDMHVDDKEDDFGDAEFKVGLEKPSESDEMISSSRDMDDWPILRRREAPMPKKATEKTSLTHPLEMTKALKTRANSETDLGSCKLLKALAKELHTSPLELLKKLTSGTDGSSIGSLKDNSEEMDLSEPHARCDSCNKTKHISTKKPVSNVSDDETDDEINTNKTDGTPCDLFGSWTSYVMNLNFEIDLESINKEDEGSTLDLCVNVTELEPPKPHDIVDPDWAFTGTAVKRIGGPIMLLTESCEEDITATFSGFCRIYNGLDTLFGSWTFVNPSRDCEDEIVSIDTKRDIMRRTNCLRKLRPRKRRARRSKRQVRSRRNWTKKNES